MALLDDVKLALRIDGSDADSEVNRLIASAVREFYQFSSGSIPTTIDYDSIEDDALNGIILMVRADYESDPVKRDQYRRAAETLWHPYKTYDWTVA